MTTTYKIVRIYLEDDRPSRTIRRGLTLEQAQAHCRADEASSSTATSAAARRRTAARGAWFDGYDADRS